MGLLKQPRKAQLRTGSCYQVSRVCSPNVRHDRSLDAAAAAAAVMNDGSVGRRERQRFINLSTHYCSFISSVDAHFVIPVRFCNPFLPIFNHVYLRNY